jgi:leucyl-tRNA synthetase
VNWCPGCHTVIANEQVLADGTCERSGDVIEKKTMPQWSLRITDYADELIDDLEGLNWPEHIKEAQRQWIGRSKGAEIDFKLNIPQDTNVNVSIKVFTTRPDTLFGATYLVLAPEHPYVEKYKDQISNWADVAAYIETAMKKDDIERGDNTKEKTGVKLEGITAKNPANGEEIPVYIADYVLGGYGTGAIMAVPAHDERDNAFARKFGLPIKQVVAPVFNKQDEPSIKKHGSYAVIKNLNGDYLVQFYRNADYHWLAGGTLEDGEDEVEALRRELVEETGYTDFSINNKICESFYDYGEVEGELRRKLISVYNVTLNSEERRDVSLMPDEIKDGLTLLTISPEDLENELAKGIPHRSAVVRHAIDSSKGTIYPGNGVLIHSGEFSGMNSEEAKVVITEKVGGRMTNTYRLRDWSIGRQRYWGVPIPIVYDPEGKAHLVPKEYLPWRLPEDVDFTPTGEPPLTKSAELKERTERIFGAGWTPEVETMDTFVDSSWYFLRYIDNQNDEEFASIVSQQNWLPVDMYFGGAEHTTMHLLYSRFWQKALHKLGLVAHNEPYLRRANHGMILGPDGNKMSKSKGNVVDPDEQVRLVGADTVKMYLAFMGPYENSSYPWDPGGVAGLRRFLERANGLTAHIVETESKETTSLLHKTIKKVSDDIEAFKFNTAISAMMILMNQVEKTGLTRDSYLTFLQVLAPFAPHITEELWHEAGNSASVHAAEFPAYDADLAKDDTVTVGVQINGKMRGTVVLSPDASQEEAMEAVHNEAGLNERLSGKEIKKIIYVPGRILNLIVSE